MKLGTTEFSLVTLGLGDCTCNHAKLAPNEKGVKEEAVYTKQLRHTASYKLEYKQEESKHRN